MPTIANRISLPFAALVFALVFTACAGALSSAEQSAPPLTGESLTTEAAQPFTLPSGLEGEVSLDSYAGERNVVLVFYRGFW
jgi:cytochrome oxidase Cu insertion factor (SCO1/SenC/PrrC family)|tara:strand:+ start:696 stop:941 length:246 start_codon:yes stop_codon:yes gene_type:complete